MLRRNHHDYRPSQTHRQKTGGPYPRRSTPSATIRQLGEMLLTVLRDGHLLTVEPLGCSCCTCRWAGSVRGGTSVAPGSAERLTARRLGRV